jgi:hypothetical protein
MSSSRIRPLRLAALVAVAALVAACSSSSAPAPTSGNGGTTQAPATSAAPAATATAAAATGAAGGAATAVPELANARAALAALASYRFSVAITGGSNSAAMPNPMTGTVINNPWAIQIAYDDLDIIAIPGKSWLKNGSSWDLAPSTIVPTEYASFGPDVLLAHDFTASMAVYYAKVGEETVNGVAATHYQCANSRALNYFSGIYGVDGGATWVGDVWIAKTGGYPVRFQLKASGSGTFSLVLDITAANDAGNKITVPS